MRLRHAPFVRVGLRLVVVDRDQHMVHDRRIAGTRLGGLDPFVFREARRDAEILIRNRPLRRHGIGLGHLDDEVRLADRPSLGKRPRGGNCLRVAERNPGRPRPRPWPAAARSSYDRCRNAHNADQRATEACVVLQQPRGSSRHGGGYRRTIKAKTVPPGQADGTTDTFAEISQRRPRRTSLIRRRSGRPSRVRRRLWRVLRQRLEPSEPCVRTPPATRPDRAGSQRPA